MPVARRPKGGGGTSRQNLEREAAKDLQRAGGSPGPRGVSPGGWTPPAPGQPIMGDEPGPDEAPSGDDYDAVDPEHEGEAVTELARSWLAEQERPGRRQPAGDFTVRVDPASATAMRDRALREHMERREQLKKNLPTAPWNQKRLTVGKPFSTPTQPLRRPAAAQPAERPAKKKAAKKKAAKKAAAAAPAGPAPDELPIEDYDSLSTAQIVSLLEDLDDDELEAVAAYEEAHRNRAGILGAIDDIFAEQPEPEPRPDADLPIEDYDDLTAEEIASLLDDLDDDELEVVAAYEESHRNRAEILDAIDDQFEEEPAPPPPAKEAPAKAAKKAPAKKAPAKKAATKKAAKKKAAKKAGKKKAAAKKKAPAKKAPAKKAAPAMEAPPADARTTAWRVSS